MIAVGLHELISIAEGSGKDPFEFTETIMNILEDDQAWLCLVPGLDVLFTSLIKHFKANCEEAQTDKSFFEDKIKSDSDSAEQYDSLKDIIKLLNK